MHDRLIHIVKLDVEDVDSSLSSSFPRQDVFLTYDPWCIGVGCKDWPIDSREVGYGVSCVVPYLLSFILVRLGRDGRDTYRILMVPERRGQRIVRA